MLPPNDSESAVMLFEAMKLVDDDADFEAAQVPSALGKVQKTYKGNHTSCWDLSGSNF